MPQTTIYAQKIQIHQGETAALVAALYNEQTGVPLTSGQVDSVVISVFQFAGGSEPATAVATIGPLLGTETFSDQLVIDNYSTQLGSGAGYNFRFLLGPGSVQMLGGFTYRAQVGVSLGGDSTVYVIYDIEVKEIL